MSDEYSTSVSELTISFACCAFFRAKQKQIHHNISMMVERLTGTELALELHVPLTIPDALAKMLYEVPVCQLTDVHYHRVVELLTSGEYVALI